MVAVKRQQKKQQSKTQEVKEIKPVEVQTEIKPEVKKEIKRKTTPKKKIIKMDVIVEEPKKVEEKPVEKQNKEVEKQTKEQVGGKKRRRFNIYYNGSKIEGAIVTGLRPKQASMKALSIIFKNFFKDKKSKKIDNSAIGKEIKFYLEESVGSGKNKKIKRFFYKGTKNYIVTKSTKEEYQKKTKKPVEFVEDENGIIGIVAKHVIIGGEERKIVHKYVNNVLMDREATKEYREEEAKGKKEEKKKV